MTPCGKGCFNSRVRWPVGSFLPWSFALWLLASFSLRNNVAASTSIIDGLGTGAGGIATGAGLASCRRSPAPSSSSASASAPSDAVATYTPTGK